MDSKSRFRGSVGNGPSRIGCGVSVLSWVDVVVIVCCGSGEGLCVVDVVGGVTCRDCGSCSGGVDLPEETLMA